MLLLPSPATSFACAVAIADAAALGAAKLCMLLLLLLLLLQLLHAAAAGAFACCCFCMLLPTGMRLLLHETTAFACCCQHDCCCQHACCCHQLQGESGASWICSDYNSFGLSHSLGSCVSGLQCLKACLLLLELNCLNTLSSILLVPGHQNTCKDRARTSLVVC